MKPRYKPLDRPEGEDTWYCHFIPKRNEKISEAANNAVSQIPDLNQGKTSQKDEKPERKSNRGKPGPNDSKYIRLAKAGGRRHLLEFHENTRKDSGPRGYPVPEWYYDSYETDEEEHNPRGKDKKKMLAPERPDWMTHIEFDPKTQKPSSRRMCRPVIGFDALSTWKRDDIERKLNNKAREMESIRFNIENPKRVRDNKRLAQGGHEKAKVVNKRTDGPRLPELPKRKLSGADLAVRWYDKWYIACIKS
ncbi:predicted protein [Nematostella vectensis]|uniref:Uncharacterized protein n=1 Tax=Nematostella vectensis TaxID=45351 RepID=A7SSJ5_NEMVE|nr:uncharacterized protein C7orf57 [Nematostella vectensis]EDO33351.1 predicted protein [Nematostella vectensis]|eukprot:XP_001625451.1 predicted protein [Nematostella vectensis]